MKFDYCLFCPPVHCSPENGVTHAGIINIFFFFFHQRRYHLYSVNLLGHRTLYIRYYVCVDIIIFIRQLQCTDASYL